MLLSDVSNFANVQYGISFIIERSSNIKNSLPNQDYMGFISFDGTSFYLDLGNNSFLSLYCEVESKLSSVYQFFRRNIFVVSQVRQVIENCGTTQRIILDLYPIYFGIKSPDLSFIELSKSVSSDFPSRQLDEALSDDALMTSWFKKRFVSRISGRDYLLCRQPDTEDLSVLDKIQSNKNILKTEDDSCSFGGDSVHLALVITGKWTRLYVGTDPDGEDKSFIRTRGISVGRYLSKKAYFLCSSSFSVTSRSKSLKNSSITELLAGSFRIPKFLHEWRRFDLFEMYDAIRTSLNFGYAKITGVQPTSYECQVFLDTNVALDAIDGETVIAASSSVPQYFDKRHLFSSFDEESVEKFLKEDESCDARSRVANIYHLLRSSSSCDCLILRYGRIRVSPNVGDYIYIPVTGEGTQYKRKRNAAQKISEGSSEYPLLAKVLSGEVSKSTTIDHGLGWLSMSPLSSRIKEKVFSKNPPTNTQIKAIDIALNTPDIALIQGPPGTGKTTVITAIVERLCELYGKDESKPGQILISGFQHSAVENIASRLSVNSLPAIKFGHRHSSDNTESCSEIDIAEWSSRTVDRIRMRYGSRFSKSISKFGLLKTSYLADPCKENEIKLLDCILEDALLYDKNIIDTAFKLRRNLNNHMNVSEISNAVDSLRIDMDSYADDGIHNCLLLINILHDHSDEIPDAQELIKLLHGVVFDSGKKLSEKDIKVLLDVKERLLSFLYPEQGLEHSFPKGEILDLIELINKQRERQVSSHYETDVLSAFVDELESNPIGIKKALEDCQIVYAATTQQSMSGELRKAKKRNMSKSYNAFDDILTYDTVIIDEAARATPSDLLIPMSLARNRIILVGDQRQLPHMIEDRLVNELKETNHIDTDLLNNTLFEMLFSSMRKLEQNDGIKRCVTLDSQYRMHPVLGDFCSKYFYESHSSTEKYISPLGAGIFNQKLKKISGLCCSICHVPYSPVQKSNHSWCRNAEADACAKLIAEWIKSDEGKDLSFGIITFYSAQVKLIKQKLSDIGLAKNYASGDDSTFIINENGREILRVGTVDSFQGLEFDVVILSAVKTYKHSDLKDSDNMSEGEKNDIAGFLCIENRLCVAMSRQKRHLCLVGDKEFFSSRVMKKKVPSLHRFVKLCEDRKNGKVFRV